MLQRRGDTATLDVEALGSADASEPTEVKPFLDFAFNGAYYVEDDGNDPLPEPGTYTVTATQLDRIGDRVSLDFGDWRDIEVLRTYCM